MSDSTDYNDLVDGTIDEVKDALQEMEQPDFEAALEAEENNRDRKTLKEWLEENIDEQEEEVVEQVEQDGFLSSVSAGPVLSAGLVTGFLIGLAVAFVLFPGVGDMDVSSAEVEASVQEYVDAASQMPEIETATIQSVSDRNGMWVVEIEMEAQGFDGEMETQTVELYVSPDGELLFPEAQSIDEAIQQIELMAQQQEIQDLEDLEDDIEIEEQTPEDETEE